MQIWRVFSPNVTAAQHVRERVDIVDQTIADALSLIRSVVVEVGL